MGFADVVPACCAGGAEVLAVVDAAVTGEEDGPAAAGPLAPGFQAIAIGGFGDEGVGVEEVGWNGEDSRMRVVVARQEHDWRPDCWEGQVSLVLLRFAGEWVDSKVGEVRGVLRGRCGGL